MALDPALVQKLRQLAKCSPEVLADQLTKLASSDPDTWRQAINTIILTMWVKNASTHSTAVEALRGVKTFQQMLESIAGGAQPGAQEPQVPPGMPGRPAVQQVAGPLSAPQGGVRIGSDGTPITDPTQVAAEEMMDQAMGLAPGAAPAVAPGRPVPQGAPPGRARGGRNNHAIGVDGQPNSPEQQEAEKILDDAMGIG